MKTEDFERQLQHQPLRPLPAEWREQILSEARKAQAAGLPQVKDRRSLLATLMARLTACFWPSPIAWAGLAAVWVLVFGLNYSSSDNPRALTKRAPLPAPEMMLTLKERERVLAELIGPFEAPVAERKRSTTQRPRSQARNEPLMG